MKTIVTGGAGFIGSTLVDALLCLDHEVLVLDDFSTGKEANLLSARARGALVSPVDIRDRSEFADTARGFEPEVIFHLAAQTDVRRSVSDPPLDARTNVEGTINVLEAARLTGARVVNVSTGGAIYGDTDVLPTPEHVEPVPDAPYGLSKYCAERYVRLYGRLFDTNGVTVRLGNVYGPRQDPLGEAGVIAIFCGLALQGLRPTVYGTGRQTRDYVYVDDVVLALVSLLEHPEAHGEYNIGTGRATSVLDIIEALAPYVDDSFQPVFADARAGEIERSCLDVSRAVAELEWRASFDLSDGLRRTIEWTRAEALRPAFRADPQGQRHQSLLEGVR